MPIVIYNCTFSAFDTVGVLTFFHSLKDETGKRFENNEKTVK